MQGLAKKETRESLKGNKAACVNSEHIWVCKEMDFFSGLFQLCRKIILALIPPSPYLSPTPFLLPAKVYISSDIIIILARQTFPNLYNLIKKKKMKAF